MLEQSWSNILGFCSGFMNLNIFLIASSVAYLALNLSLLKISIYLLTFIINRPCSSLWISLSFVHLFRSHILMVPWYWIELIGFAFSPYCSRSVCLVNMNEYFYIHGLCSWFSLLVLSNLQVICAFGIKMFHTKNFTKRKVIMMDIVL